MNPMTEALAEIHICRLRQEARRDRLANTARAGRRSRRQLRRTH